MRQLYIYLFLLFNASVCWSCSCFPYEPNFYKNIDKNSFTCLVVFDSLQLDSFHEHSFQEIGHVDILKVFGSNIASTPRTRIKVIGQNGLNCGESLYFKHGDTLLMSLDAVGLDSFYLDGACGIHYLKVKNGCVHGLCGEEYEAKITKILNYQDPKCYCFPAFGAFNFITNVIPNHTYVLAAFHRSDYNYSHDGFKSQTGYFTLIDTINQYGTHRQDTMVVIGEDGINCGELLQRFTPGDTLFLALSAGYHRPFQHDTFYLKGWPCGTFYLKVKNGLSGDKNISQIKSIILDKLSSKVEDITNSSAIVIYPNPSSDLLNISTRHGRIDKIYCYDIMGRETILNPMSTAYGFDIDISRLGIGTYFLKIGIGDGYVMKRFIKI